MDEVTLSLPWWLGALVLAAAAGAAALAATTSVYKHIICWKYLFCGWKAVVPLVSALPAALGVFLLVLVFAIMDGFVEKTREMTRGTLSDVIVDASLGGLPHYDEFIERLRKVPGVASATPVIQTYAVCRIAPPDGDLRIVRPCILIGIRPAEKARMGRFLQYLQRQAPEPSPGQACLLAPGEDAGDPSGGPPADPAPPGRSPARVLDVPEADRRARREQDLPDRPGAIAGTGLVGRPVTELVADRLPALLGWRVLSWALVGAAGLVFAFVLGASRRRPGRPAWRAAAIAVGAVAGGALLRAVALQVVLGGRTERVMWKKTVDRPLLAYGQDLVVGTIPVRPSGGFDLGPGGVPRAQYQAFTLVDTFKSGYWESDASHVYVPFDVAQRLAGMAGRPAEGEDPGEPPRTSQVQVRLAPGAEAEAVVRAVERAWFDFIAARRPKDFAFPVVNTWETQQRTILGVVEMERNITALMLGVMLIGFAILTALISYVMAYIKGRDVGILKALGASDAGVGSLFLGYGFVIGLLGTAIGLGAALAMLHWLDPIEMYVNQFIGRPVFPRDVYYFDRIPRNLSAAWAVGVSLAVLSLSTLASMAGGLLAALKQPVETLRYE